MIKNTKKRVTLVTLKEENLDRRAKPIQWVELMDTDCFNVVSHRLNQDGYPKVRRGNGRPQWRMHRYIYTIAKGPIPKGKVVRHTCDNTRCINPDHLVLGTQADNVKDMVERNRHIKGERVQASKLTEDQVRFIFTSRLSSETMIKLFPVSKAIVAGIRNRKYWKHVTDHLNSTEYIPKRKSKLSLGQLLDMFYLKSKGCTEIEIADAMGIKRVRLNYYKNQLSKTV